MKPAAIGIIVLALALAACAKSDPRTLAGYVEADLLYISPQDQGLVAEIAVVEGATVGNGAVLFRIDPARMALQVEQAEAAANAAAARVGPGGPLEEAAAEAEAGLNNARRTHERSRALVKQGVVTVQRADNDRAAYETAAARFERAKAEWHAAQRDAAAAQAQAGLWRKRLDDLTVTAPEAGTVERIYRRAGELAGPGDPVLALLPPDNRKIKFFAPEAALASLQPGGEIGVTCDRCPESLKARISYVSAEPQFTPPVIFSLEERAKLVFLVEARPIGGPSLTPGLPVTVRLP
jgi:HlyD family secretion protein